MTEPEKAAFAPVLVLVGATEGFSEGIWLVALLSLVEPEGKLRSCSVNGIVVTDYDCRSTTALRILRSGPVHCR